MFGRGKRGGDPNATLLLRSIYKDILIDSSPPVFLKKILPSRRGGRDRRRRFSWKILKDGEKMSALIKSPCLIPSRPKKGGGEEGRYFFPRGEEATLFWPLECGDVWTGIFLGLWWRTLVELPLQKMSAQEQQVFFAQKSHVRQKFQRRLRLECLSSSFPRASTARTRTYFVQWPAAEISKKTWLSLLIFTLFKTEL